MTANIIKIYRGAESIVRLIKENNRYIIEKYRMPRTYRIKQIDEKLRKRRTKQEANILKKSEQYSLPAPRLIEVDKYTIKMEYIDGIKKTSEEIDKADVKNLGQILAQFHNKNIIHGDFTLANILFKYPLKDSNTNKPKSDIKNKNHSIFVIDFGLGFFSNAIEHKAIDAFTMFRSLGEEKGILFLKSYLEQVESNKMIARRILKIRSRFRYGKRYEVFEHVLMSLINSIISKD